MSSLVRLGRVPLKCIHAMKHPRKCSCGGATLGTLDFRFFAVVIREIGSTCLRSARSAAIRSDGSSSEYVLEAKENLAWIPRMNSWLVPVSLKDHAESRTRRVRS